MKDSGLVSDEYIKKVGELQYKPIDLAQEKSRKEENYTTEINDLRTELRHSKSLRRQQVRIVLSGNAK